MPQEKRKTLLDVTVECITGGKGNRPHLFTFISHGTLLIYFITWGILFGLVLHWPNIVNLWVFSIVAAGTGILILVIVLTDVSYFLSNNVSSNLEQPGQHYQTGLIHVGIITRGTLGMTIAVIVPAILQLTFLGLNEKCCIWSGAITPSFLASYLISLFYYHYGVTLAIHLLLTDFKPVYQITEILPKSK